MDMEKLEKLTRARLISKGVHAGILLVWLVFFLASLANRELVLSDGGAVFTMAIWALFLISNIFYIVLSIRVERIKKQLGDAEQGRQIDALKAEQRRLEQEIEKLKRLQKTDE